MTDEHRNAITWRDGKNGQLRRTISQSDNKKPEELKVDREDHF